MKKWLVSAILVSALTSFPVMLTQDDTLELEKQIQQAKTKMDANKPVFVWGGGVGARWENSLATAKFLSSGPAIGIPAYRGGQLIPDFVRAGVDYLVPPKAKETGQRLLKDLVRVYQGCGRIDAAFHSGFVVALNQVPEELDALLGAGKLRFGKLALAGVHVQPKLAAVLNKHREMGNIQDWITLERAYVPGKQRGDLFVLASTPNLEFKSYLGATIGKGILAADILTVGLMTGGKLGIRAYYYGVSPEHFMETYAPDAWKFFGYKPYKPNEEDIRKVISRKPEIPKFKRQDSAPFFWPPDKNLAAAGKDPGGVLFSTGNTYVLDTSGATPKLEQAVLGSRPGQGSISWKLRHEGESYEAVAIPLGKVNIVPAEVSVHVAKQENTVVFQQGNDVLTLKYRPVGPYLQILQIAEGKVVNKTARSVVFQVYNVVFSTLKS